ncbi:hypothetical protein CISG_06757 [Coccidioides immitis RMSCC 3703]|uniref:Uncharacterized protein n=1 Tax=Coccidioides immitis RMSCC 3703 TaxID=454286 RepID=A0A0J8QYE2_COCIT|nr:hypothetical protein CISG_06757 [Coccidioides immitis RMSCC 3703]
MWVIEEDKLEMPLLRCSTRIDAQIDKDQPCSWDPAKLSAFNFNLTGCALSRSRERATSFPSSRLNTNCVFIHREPCCCCLLSNIRLQSSALWAKGARSS